jgi:phosphoribosylformylglycinamidine synthase subunit PurS
MAVARIQVKLKPTVLDAQGAQIKNALLSLGFDQVGAVRAGRYFEVELPDGETAERDVRAMCEQLLSNPIIETYDFEIAVSGPRSADNAG